MADTPENTFEAGNEEELNLNELNENEAPQHDQPENISRFNEEIPEKPKSSAELEAVYDVPVQVSAVLGKSSMQVHQLLKLGRGAVVELNQLLNEPVEILANEIPIAKGEIIVTDEGYIGVKITDLMISRKGSGGSLISKSAVGSFGK